MKTTAHWQKGRGLAGLCPIDCLLEPAPVAELGKSLAAKTLSVIWKRVVNLLVGQVIYFRCSHKLWQVFRCCKPNKTGNLVTKTALVPNPVGAKGKKSQGEVCREGTGRGA